MLHFFLLVKINGAVYEIGYRDLEEYKIIRLFHEILEVMVKYGHNEMDLIEISVVLPWTTSRQRKLISNDSELYSVFEEIFTNSCPVIEFMVHTGLGGQSCHESVVIGYENPVNIGVSMGSDKFEKLSEDDFIGGHSSDEENSLS